MGILFTGIVEEVGTLVSLVNGRIAISCQKIIEDVSNGDSICVNGICLTVTNFDAGFFTADVMPETIRRSSLAELEPNSPVNLERALQPTSRMGGHIVAGHVDGVGKIMSFEDEGNAIILKIGCDSKLLRQIAPKGSVALDGVSLTVVESRGDFFSVSLIPTTREQTNFKSKTIGSSVNIETDVIAKYLDQILHADLEEKAKSVTITREFLTEHGF